MKDLTATLFANAVRRLDMAELMLNVAGRPGPHSAALSALAAGDVIEARFAVLRWALALADPSQRWHQNDPHEIAPLCSVVRGNRAFSVVPAPDGMGRWGNELELVVTTL